MRKEKDEMNEDKNKVAVMYSERKKRLQTASKYLIFLVSMKNINILYLQATRRKNHQSRGRRKWVPSELSSPT